MSSQQHDSQRMTAGDWIDSIRRIPLLEMCSTTRSRLVCRLLVVRAVVSAMKHKALIVTDEENIWWVRLDGVEVVSFFGPHAKRWAYREREELAQLLEAQLDAELDEQHHEERVSRVVLKDAGHKSANSLGADESYPV